MPDRNAWFQLNPKSTQLSASAIIYLVILNLPEPLEPYKRYSITLHTRPNKGTCNLKHINNSESTYGSTQFYVTEGCESQGCYFQ